MLGLGQPLIKLLTHMIELVWIVFILTGISVPLTLLAHAAFTTLATISVNEHLSNHLSLNEIRVNFAKGMSSRTSWLSDMFVDFIRNPYKRYGLALLT
ncbi:hypothetical protein HK102_000278 [Quaeritorhiza haematococci]|nr:hypothetical protein HK102_000278 [Quaeritorhiza haematococci]